MPGLGSATTVSLTGGSQSLTSAGWAYSYIAFAGALPSHTTVTLASAAGRRCLFKNSTSGAYWLRIIGAGGGSTYIGPGQSKILWTDASGVLQGEDLQYWTCDIDASLVVGAAGTYTLASIALPPRMRLQPALVSGITSLSFAAYGGQVRLGTAAGGAQVMALTGVPTADTIIGHLAAHLTGTDADDGGAFFYGASQVLRWEFVAAGAFTAGAIRLHLIGKLL